MNVNEDLKFVDDIITDISGKLGKLTGYNVISLEDGISIIRELNEKYSQWMFANFDIADISEFADNL